MKNIHGAITALVTPFVNDKIDEKGFIQNIQHQIAQGINGIVVMGSTGEDGTLSHEERTRLITIALKEAKGKVPVIVGTGCLCTKNTIAMTKQAQELGADAALVVTPYYNKPTQEGIFRHFEAITANVNLPIIIYNNPSRCSTNIEVNTMLRIAGLPYIIGVKEASGNITQASHIIHTVSGHYPHFRVFSGDDALNLSMMAQGASGTISVVSNLIPHQIAALTTAIAQNNFEQARLINEKLVPLYQAAFFETNPIPIKAAMQLCGMPAGECRLPLSPLAPHHQQALKAVLQKMQLIHS